MLASLRRTGYRIGAVAALLALQSGLTSDACWLVRGVASHTHTLGLAPAAAQEPADTNYDESRVPAYALPDPLVTFDGRPVRDQAMWRDVRRPEILRAFASEVYGHVPSFDAAGIPLALRFEERTRPTTALDGLATRKEVRIHLFADPDAPWIDLLLWVPNQRTAPAPVFLGLNYGNQGVQADPTIAPSRNAVSQPGEHAHRWPVQQLLERGYAVATFHGGDLEIDRHGSGCRFSLEGWQRGLRNYLLRRAGADGKPEEVPEDQWGALAVWAWGLSRALDYLESDRDVDAARVAVFGHSRLGKTALWAGAQDERFALVISNNSGQGGAALGRRRYGESVAASYALSGIWYCRNYQQYGGREEALPVDAHLLIAAIAPRPVYVASAEQDRWADPRGEFLAAMHAEPVYRLFGFTGVGVDQLPPVNQPVGDQVGYHIREGDHEIAPYDWERYLEFADRHWQLR
jgi:hypothetical protein